MATFTLNASIAAPVETVFDVLSDHSRYADITPLRSSVLERQGTPESNGVGAIRRLALAGPPIREEITEFERPRRLSYKALSGVPAKEHYGSVELTESGQGTLLRWELDSTPKLVLLDPIWPMVMKPVISQLIKGVKQESERRAGSGVR
jgi:uncharacterized protein YndB with AHSA1/START domain